MIHEQLRRAIQAKGWSDSKAAAECRVGRTFLGKLLSGERPPRKRRGRLLADRDERYLRLQETLGLPKSFIDEVKRLQTEPRRVDTADLSELDRKTWAESIKEFSNEVRIGAQKFLETVMEAAAKPNGLEQLEETIRTVSWRLEGGEQLTPRADLKAVRRFVGDVAEPRPEHVRALSDAVYKLGDKIYVYEGAIDPRIRRRLAGLLYRIASMRPVHWDEIVGPGA